MKKALTQEKNEQNKFEHDEQRVMVNKRRKRMPAIEDYDLDEILTEAQKNQIIERKKQKTSSDNEFSSFSTDDGLGPNNVSSFKTNLPELKNSIR